MCRSLSGKKEKEGNVGHFWNTKKLATVILVDGRNLEPPGLLVKHLQNREEKELPSFSGERQIFEPSTFIGRSLQKEPPPKII